MPQYINELKGYQPLCLLSDGGYLLYKKGRFLIFKKKIKNVFKIKRSFFLIVKESTKITQRLFRTRIKASLVINDREIIFSKNSRIFHLNVETQSLTVIFHSSDGFSTPLNLTKSLTKDYIAVFGDYGGNPNYDAVNIYGVDNNLVVTKLYSFEHDSIKHIHNIIPDRTLTYYYIFTGDNEEKAGIYLANSNFNKIKAVFIGEPKARIVSAFDTSEGLLCATDSVSHQNSIYLLNSKSGQIIKEISKINGSCIYATQCATGFIFSTTVEPPEENTFLNKITTKRGIGILSNSIDIIYVTKNFEVKSIRQLKKDFLPAHLFQFGSVMFASGQENENIILGYCCSTKKSDGEIIYLNNKA